MNPAVDKGHKCMDCFTRLNPMTHPVGIVVRCESCQADLDRRMAEQARALGECLICQSPGYPHCPACLEMGLVEGGAS